MAMTAKQAQAVAERYAKAVELVEQGKVFKLYGSETQYVVVNGNGLAYLVELTSGECTCPDSQYRCSKLDILCKHALAVALYVERQAGTGEAAPQPPADDPVDEPEWEAAAAELAADAPRVEQSFCHGCGSPVPAGVWICTGCEAQARGLLNDLL